MKLRLHWTISIVILCACGTAVPVLDGADAGVDGGDAGDSSRRDTLTVDLDSGSTDSGADRDVFTDTSVSPDHYFRTVPATIDFSVGFDRCEVREGASTVLAVTMHWFSSCHSPGPIEVSIDEPSHTISVRGTLWEEVGGGSSCTPVGAAVMRDVIVPPLSLGRWTATGGLEIDVTTGAACDPRSANLGESCTADCDCVEGLCIGMIGGVCESQCQIPCLIDLDCGPLRMCDRGGPGPLRCVERTVDGCVGGDCPVGMRCAVGAGVMPFLECVWDTNIRGSTRTPCTTNTECMYGHECVEAGGERHCEVRCSTEVMTCPGPPPHACVPVATATPGNWVCEWTGE